MKFQLCHLKIIKDIREYVYVFVEIELTKTAYYIFYKQYNIKL